MFPSLFLRILSVFLLIFFGGLARKAGIIDAAATTRLAGSVKNFFYPALIFHALFNNFSAQELAGNYLLPAGSLMFMAAGYCIGLFSARFMRFRDSKEKGSFLFQCAINNYSFLPLPIVLMLWGEHAAAMLIFSTLGSEIAVWTFGVFALCGNRFQRESLKNLLSAPMLSLILAVSAVFIRDFLSGGALFEHHFAAEAGASLMAAAEMLGGAAVPLAMFIVGSRIVVLESRHIFRVKQFFVAVLRLAIIPAAGISLFSLLPLSGEMRLVLAMVAVMPSANASVVLAEAYSSDADFAASSVLITHIFALVTVPLWLSFLV